MDAAAPSATASGTRVACLSSKTKRMIGWQKWLIGIRNPFHVDCRKREVFQPEWRANSTDFGFACKGYPDQWAILGGAGCSLLDRVFRAAAAPEHHGVVKGRSAIRTRR